MPRSLLESQQNTLLLTNGGIALLSLARNYEGTATSHNLDFVD